jgi:hypothetical protein
MDFLKEIAVRSICRKFSKFFGIGQKATRKKACHKQILLQSTHEYLEKDGLNLYAYAHNNPLYYTDPDGQFAFAIPILIPLFEIAFGAAITTVALLPAAETTLAYGLLVYGGCLLAKSINHQTHTADPTDILTKDEESVQEEEKEEKNREKFKFPENPDDLLPELPRDKRGRIQTADNLRIRPEKHPMEPGDTYNPRHHGQHYRIETRRNPTGKWRNENTHIVKPDGYQPNTNMGTGFLPGEAFPGASK